MNRRLQIKHKRRSYNWHPSTHYRRFRLKDFLLRRGKKLPILEEWDQMVPVGREIL